MNIISWNVNGLRAFFKKGCFNWFFNISPDIFCIQEVRATIDQLPEEIKNLPGYFSYFNWPTIKKGYSGVAVYTKIKPDKVIYGMGINEFDQEGRLITLFFKDLVIINGYFPNGGMGAERLKFKLNFYDAFLKYIEKLKKKKYKIIFCGDINTAHKEIDLARPKENEKHTGFLPIERAWIDNVINHGYIDTFRFFYPEKKGAYTYWDIKTSARERNVGWRLDYFFVSANLQKKLKESPIFEQIKGSDHCPIGLKLS